MRKTIITASNQRLALGEILLQNNEVLTGVHILPFSAFFYNSNVNPDVDAVQNYLSLQKLELTHLKKLVSFPRTYHDFKALSQKLDAYEIDLDSLPETTEYDQDIKKILIDIKQDFNEPTQILHYLEEGLAHHQLMYMQKHKHQKITVSTSCKPQNIQYKNALNFRQELEGVIQYILENKLKDVALVIPDYQTRYPFVVSALKRYGLDIELTPSFDLVKRQYIAFIDYLLSPSTQNILNILNSDVFKIDKSKEIIFYIQHFEMTPQQILHDFNQIKLDEAEVSKNGKTIFDIQEGIQNAVSLLQEKLLALDKLSLQEQLLLSLEYITEFDPRSSRKIHNYLQNIFPYINKDTILFIKDHIQRMKSTTQDLGNIKVYDLNSLPIEPVNHLIAMGLNAKNFPGISAQTGILDEAFLARIKGYPSQTQRNFFQVQEKLKVFSKASNLILSYHLIDYEGKKQEPSFEVENFLNSHGIYESSSWKVVEKNPFMPVDNQLSESIAKKLYLKDKRLHSSASALELYTSNPLEFFFQYGLGLKEPLDFGFDSRIVGTFSHEYLEKKLLDSLQSYESLWNQYQTYFPKDNALLQSRIRFNKKTLDFHVQNLNEMMQDSDFRILEQEKRVQDDQSFDGFVMKGFIDRIDAIEREGKTYKMIIDYKSSVPNFGAASVLRGEKIQLLIYAVLLSKYIHENEAVFGVHYYSFNRDSASEKLYSYKSKLGAHAQEEESFEDYKERHLFQGWNFFDLDSFKVNPNIFKGSKRAPAKIFRVNDSDKFYDMTLTQNLIKTLLAKIRRNILSGVIDKDILNEDFKTRPIRRLDETVLWTDEVNTNGNGDFENEPV